MFSSDMSASLTLFPHLRLDSQGRAWVDGANVKVSEVAADFLAHGSSVEEMAIQFPHLSPSMIHAALAYFYDHREEYEDALDASLKASQGKAAATMDSPLRMRMSKVSGRP